MGLTLEEGRGLPKVGSEVPVGPWYREAAQIFLLPDLEFKSKALRIISGFCTSSF